MKTADTKSARFAEAYNMNEKKMKAACHEPDRGPRIHCYPSMSYFYPLDPRPEEVFLGDIARSLSHMARFNGHTREFYSVAEHSLLVHQIVEAMLANAGHTTTIAPKYALLHDAAEAYIGDIMTPLKDVTTVGAQHVRLVEGRILNAILMRLRVPCNYDNPVVAPYVETADRIALAIEMRDMKGMDPAEWGLSIPEWTEGLFKAVGLSPEAAERAFLAAWKGMEKNNG